MMSRVFEMVSASPPPEVYDRDAYVSWHEASFPGDVPLELKLKGIHDELMSLGPSRYLEPLGQLLTHTAVYCQAEAEMATEGLMAGAYKVELTEHVKTNKYPETTFKSVGSILDKMWRKNRDAVDSGRWVDLDKVKTGFGDLIRTSVVAPTQYHAGFFATRLQNWERIIKDDDMRKAHLASVAAVSVDAEAKLASGYFAYHCSVRFSDGQTVEVQVYSQIVSAWRNLAHRVYEHGRLEKASRNEPGTVSSRLISLGHVLHLAECELERLAADMRRK